MTLRAWFDAHPIAGFLLGWFFFTLAASAPLLAKNGAWWDRMRREHPHWTGLITLFQTFGAALPMLLDGLSLLVLGRPLPRPPPPANDGGETSSQPPPPGA